ncbi:phage tail protein [Symbiopectobacterium purcellii]|uniref:phage tail protein n=1 Tax=Symbiopectobacterium purcellii TaxID=2871826 RepID=UPI003F82ED5D
MSTKFFALLTNIGAARLANATAIGSRLDITHMAVGDGGGVLPTPNPAQTKLINEKRRAAINSLRVDPDNANQIIAEQVIPENEGGFWIRELGLFDAEGNLIAVANCAETYKPQLQEGSGRIQTVRMILIVSSTETVSLKIDPAVVLATRGYVDEAIATHEKSRKHPDATLKEKGLVQLSSATDSASETLAATPKAVKAANDNANGRVPSGRTVNGKALSADIALGAADVGAYTKAETDTKVNAATDAANNAATAAASANDNADSRVPARRKVNGKALNADITLAAGDVGAYSKAETNTELEKKVDTTQLQKSQDDTTAGALVINGGHGLGANARPRAAGATGGAAGCGFFSYQANNADNPFGGTGASGIHVQESTTYGWDLLGRDGGGMDFRLRQINNGVASAWSTLWTSANLVKQSSAFDGTTGSVMLNGAWGWGGIAKRLNFDYTIWTENKLSVSQPISLFLLFACAHLCSIGLRSGEYVGKYSTIYPASMMTC